MKHVVTRALSLALCAALLCVPALAAEEEDSRQAEPPAHLPLTRVWGTVAWEEGSLRLANSDPDDPYNDVVVHLAETTAVVDAVTGAPMDAADIAGGDTVYAWVGPAMTLSLPPQATAEVIVANIPADFAAPQYYEMRDIWYNVTEEAATPAFFPIDGTTEGKVTAVDGGTVVVKDGTEYLSYKTKDIYTWRDLRPGDRFLAWTNEEGEAYRVLRFPYAYRGYLDAVNITGKTVHANGNLLIRPYTDEGRVPYGMEEPYLPLRSLAEAIGLSVTWDAERGAVVSENGEPLFSAVPGSSVVQTPEGERGLSSPVLIADGVTYLPAYDLVDLLNLFWA